MDTSLIQFVLLLLLTALYLPVIFFAIQRREDAQNTPAWLVTLYALLAMVLALTEAFWRNGQNDLQGLRELQNYSALALIALMIVTVKIFLKRDMWWAWVALWAFWMLGLALIAINALNLPEILWTNNDLILQRDRLGPA